jgi:hypothetical protein
MPVPVTDSVYTKNFTISRPLPVSQAGSLPLSCNSLCPFFCLQIITLCGKQRHREQSDLALELNPLLQKAPHSFTQGRAIKTAAAAAASGCDVAAVQAHLLLAAEQERHARRVH